MIAVAALLAASLAGCGSNKEESGKLSLKIGAWPDETNKESLNNQNKSKDEFMKVVSVNLLGTFLMSKAFGKNMFERKSGSIINISSNNGIDSYYKESIDYDASKAGVINMGHNLANIYSPYVRVNTVCPGWIDTPMNESINPSFKEKEINKILLKRFARPEEVANLVYFLASEDASYINDSVIKIDGGKVC